MKTLGIIEFCVNHPARTRNLLTNFAKRRFADSTLIEWVARRVTDCQHIDQVVIACGREEDRDELISVVPQDIEIFANRSADADPLDCFAATLAHYQADAAVRIDVNSPFVDPTLIDRLITSAGSTPGNDYAGFCSPRGTPIVQARFGVLAEWCSAAAITQANQEATLPEDRRIATRYLYTHPELFQLRLLPASEALVQFTANTTNTNDDANDWDDAQAIYEALGPERIEWNRIAEILGQQTALVNPISH